MNKLMNDVAINNTQELIIEGASCASCVGKIEVELNSLEGVDKAEMNFALRTVSVTGKADIQALIKVVESIGYNAKMKKI